MRASVIFIKLARYFRQRRSESNASTGVGVHAGAGAHWVAVAEDVVDAAGRGPVLVILEPGDRKGRLVAGVGPVPGVGGDGIGGVRGVFERVILPVDASGFDRQDLGVDGYHGVAEAVQLR